MTAKGSYGKRRKYALATSSDGGPSGVIATATANSKT